MEATTMTERARVQDRVIGVLAEAVVLPREDVEDLHTSLREDLGMDSMDFVDLITLLEQELGRQIKREELAYVHTVGDVVELVFRFRGLSQESGAVAGTPTVLTGTQAA
jgi:acyl carrier protein